MTNNFEDTTENKQTPLKDLLDRLVDARLERREEDEQRLRQEIERRQARGERTECLGSAPKENAADDLAGSK